jgi:hypothetical protein
LIVSKLISVAFSSNQIKQKYFSNNVLFIEKGYCERKLKENEIYSLWLLKVDEEK